MEKDNEFEETNITEEKFDEYLEQLSKQELKTLSLFLEFILTSEDPDAFLEKRGWYKEGKKHNYCPHCGEELK